MGGRGADLLELRLDLVELLKAELVKRNLTRGCARHACKRGGGGCGRVGLLDGFVGCGRAAGKVTHEGANGLLTPLRVPFFLIPFKSIRSTYPPNF